MLEVWKCYYHRRAGQAGQFKLIKSVRKLLHMTCILMEKDSAKFEQTQNLEASKNVLDSGLLSNFTEREFWLRAMGFNFQGIVKFYKWLGPKLLTLKRSSFRSRVRRSLVDRALEFKSVDLGRSLKLKYIIYVPTYHWSDPKTILALNYINHRW